MARKAIHDPNQPLLPGFGGEALNGVYDQYKLAGRALRDAIQTARPRDGVQSEYDLSQEINVTLSIEIKRSGMSRDDFADALNEYLGRTEERHKLGECRKPWTGETVDKLVSDAPNRPIDAYILFGIQHILGFGVINTIVSAKGGHVVSDEDRRLLALARLGELKTEISQVEKQLKK